MVFRNDTNGIEADVMESGGCGTIEDNFLRDNGENGLLVTGELFLPMACVVRDNVVEHNRLERNQHLRRYGPYRDWKSRIAQWS